jgi:hypothetical protein
MAYASNARRDRAEPAGPVSDGTILSFDPATAWERGAMRDWLAHDLRRGQAAWDAEHSFTEGTCL